MMMQGGWENYAKNEPLFAVLTRPEYLRERLTSDSEARFFETGEDHVAALVAYIRSTLDPHFFSSLRVLEFGCGPGRLAIAFAARFAEVVAVDRSDAMLQSARTYAARFGAGNIVFRTLDEFRATDERFDLVNCHLVLQRLPEADGLKLLRLLLDRIGRIGVFQLPYRDRASRQRRLLRSFRRHIPGLNPLVNKILGKATRTPLQSTTSYDLASVLSIVQQCGFTTAHIVASRDGDLDTATIYVQRPPVTAAPRAAAGDSAAPLAPAAHFINPRELIATRNLESLNAAAEAYFSSLADWEHHLIKPFATLDEAPGILINLAVLLQGMKLRPGDTVLDFGAGTGWLSRILTQLGCRVIVSDVSLSALRIARETFRRVPIVGSRPSPLLLPYEGRQIALRDETVDRIICFDAFHHVPNPDDVIREFGRILRSGGIAGFAEPGPAHSQSAQSQFEMRTYGILENDMDLQSLWRTARHSGFNNLRVAAFTTFPFHVPLPEYDDLLAGGRIHQQWAEHGRAHLHDVRNFFLFKGDGPPLDSRHRAGLRASIDVLLREQPRTGEPLQVEATIRNVGTAAWLPSGASPGAVSLGCHLYSARRKLMKFDFTRWPICSQPLKPDESVTLAVHLPPLSPGRYYVEFDCVAEHVTWFAQVGSETRTIQVEVGASA
jgi:2-polyprenyl-3-methyl-5-hydroxy-6-metoxy-1,4-benzoquinol methylase